MSSPMPSAGSFGGFGGAQTTLFTPEGDGWVFEIRGYHYFNKDRNLQGGEYVHRAFLSRLEDGKIELPDDLGSDKPVQVTMKELGIKYPILLPHFSFMVEDYEVPNPAWEEEQKRLREEGLLGMGAANEFGTGGFGMGRNQVPDPDAVPEFLEYDRYEFVVQFCWQPTPRMQRLENRRRALEQEQQQPTQDPEQERVAQ